MKPFQLPSGLQRGIPFIISADWSAEGALAAFDMPNDLCDVIWNRYQIPIQTLLQQQQIPTPETDPTISSAGGPPF